MSELFKTTPKSPPPQKKNDKKNKTTINTVGGEWFIYNINAKFIPYQEKVVHQKRENLKRKNQRKAF